MFPSYLYAEAVRGRLPFAGDVGRVLLERDRESGHAVRSGGRATLGGAGRIVWRAPSSEALVRAHAAAANPWLSPPAADAAPLLRLFCVPYAGVGASVFRDWPKALPRDIEVCRVRLPGRESRFGEAPFEAMEPLIDALAPAVALALDRPYAIYGHSMGALVAFELARRLRAMGCPPPAGLFVGAMRAPHCPDRYPPLYALPAAELRAELRRRYGMVNEALDHPEIFETLLPTLRADSRVCDTYAYRPAAPLDCAIAAWGGRRDDHVLEEEIRAWGAQTAGEFSAEMLEADHFFMSTAPGLFLVKLTRHLAAIVLPR